MKLYKSESVENCVIVQHSAEIAQRYVFDRDTDLNLFRKIRNECIPNLFPNSKYKYSIIFGGDDDIKEKVSEITKKPVDELILQKGFAVTENEIIEVMVYVLDKKN
jgi:hypothetical protein